jgi:intein/homing endonuclease
MKLTDIAELCGIILGDGSLHKSCNRITIVGSCEDKYYFRDWVIPLFRKTFEDINPKLNKNKLKNSYNITLENKKVFETFVKKFGMQRGAKININVPFFILENNNLISHFLKGLFDTDGSLKFSKQTKKLNYYPRIQLCFRDSPFAHQIGILLKSLNFNFGKWRDKNDRGYGKNPAEMIFYYVSGKENCIRWMKLIRPANSVHVTKYLFWQKYGYYVPKLTLKERLRFLNTP